MNSVSIKTYKVSDLKRVYRVLHKHILVNTDLMGSEVLEDLQAYLQGVAALSGIDIANHGAWDRWILDETEIFEIVRHRRPHLRLVPKV